MVASSLVRLCSLLVLLLPVCWTHSQSSPPHIHRGRNTTSGDDVANGSQGKKAEGHSAHTLSLRFLGWDPPPWFHMLETSSSNQLPLLFCVVRASPACVKIGHNFVW